EDKFFSGYTPAQRAGRTNSLLSSGSWRPTHADLRLPRSHPGLCLRGDDLGLLDRGLHQGMAGGVAKLTRLKSRGREAPSPLEDEHIMRSIASSTRRPGGIPQAPFGLNLTLRGYARSAVACSTPCRRANRARGRQAWGYTRRSGGG